jgi:hypothetical protein
MLIIPVIWEARFSTDVTPSYASELLARCVSLNWMSYRSRRYHIPETILEKQREKKVAQWSGSILPSSPRLLVVGQLKETIV